MPNPSDKADKWPIFDAENARVIDAAKYRLRIDGLVEKPLEMTLDEIKSMPSVVKNLRMVSVSGWSVRNDWQGALFGEILKRVKRKPRADFANFHSAGGRTVYTTCVPVKDLALPNVVLVWGVNGRPLRHEEGAPARMLIPHLWGYKSCKWLARIEFTDKWLEGYWEIRGYPNDAPIPPGTTYDVNSGTKRQMNGGEITDF
jgi:DMSO/TMAO reductase YedYZ molybdopterin-dependent catalytic subunit